MSNHRLLSHLNTAMPKKTFLIKFLIFFSWLTSLFSLWGMARFYRQLSFSLFPEGLLITCIFLVFIFWSIYWIFSFSERFEQREKEQKITSPPANDLTKKKQNPLAKANQALQQSLEQELLHSEEQTNHETRDIFAKIEKIKVDQKVYTDLVALKRKTHARVLQARQTEILAIAQLHQDIIHTIDQSEHLTNMEKAEMYPDIHQFITSHTFNRWVIKE